MVYESALAVLHRVAADDVGRGFSNGDGLGSFLAAAFLAFSNGLWDWSRTEFQRACLNCGLVLRPKFIQAGHRGCITALTIRMEPNGGTLPCPMHRY